MTSSPILGTLESNAASLKVAIVGSGPSGFYAAEELLQSVPKVEVTLVECLPAPYGLVRYGVAPDHPKLKQPIRVYEGIGKSPGVHFIGNVHVGRDVAVQELMESHHAVILACGAQNDRKLGIPGEALPGSYSATEFVGWYNGHPDYRSLKVDLTEETVVLVGQGNVAIDVARILAKPVDELRRTDIAEHALDVLAASRVREIHIVGRRGPAQSKFTPQELSELGTIPGCAVVVDSRDLALNDASLIEVADKRNRNAAKNMEIYRRFAATHQNNAARRCYLRYFGTPARVLGPTKVESIRFIKTTLAGEPFHQEAWNSNESFDIPCGMLIRSIGYYGTPIDGLPFDDALGVLRQRDGRLEDENERPLYGLYATGWIKRGPSGIIGTNRADSMATVATLLSDLPRLDKKKKNGARGLASLLAGRGKQFVSFADWQRIDALEVRRGRAKGKPREKITEPEAMLAAARVEACEEFL